MRRGFTLIELLVTVLILTLLVGGAASGLSSARKRNVVKNTAETLKLAMAEAKQRSLIASDNSTATNIQIRIWHKNGNNQLLRIEIVDMPSDTVYQTYKPEAKVFFEGGNTKCGIVSSGVCNDTDNENYRYLDFVTLKQSIAGAGTINSSSIIDLSQNVQVYFKDKDDNSWIERYKVEINYLSGIAETTKMERTAP